MTGLKYAAKPIGQLSLAEIKIWSEALLLKIHVITGWVIPTGNLLNILVDQFEKKLMEDYGSLNHYEIEYAFRSKGTLIPDWGKQMNLQLLDQVLIPYMDDRYKNSLAEERQSAPPQQQIYSDDDNDNLHRQDVEMYYQRCRNGQVPHNIPDYFKYILVKDGLMQPEESLSVFFVKKLGNNATNIYIKTEQPT